MKYKRLENGIGVFIPPPPHYKWYRDHNPVFFSKVSKTNIKVSKTNITVDMMDNFTSSDSELPEEDDDDISARCTG